MVEISRRKWTDEESNTLMGLWEAVGSVALIARMMKRSSSSVQTQASRLNLPPRSEDRDRHRRRWADGDDTVLLRLVEQATTADGRILIKDVSSEIGRSVDAIVVRLERLLGEEADIIGRIEVPPPPRTPAMPKERVCVAEESPSKSPRDKSDYRKCLRCDRKFWSDGFHNRVCPKCKREKDWLDDV